MTSDDSMQSFSFAQSKEADSPAYETGKKISRLTNKLAGLSREASFPEKLNSLGTEERESDFKIERGRRQTLREHA